MRSKVLFALAASTFVLGTYAAAQSVISAHSGVIQLAEGDVELNGVALSQKFGEFGTVKNGETLAAKDGRAEVLLTPGVFLRISDHSSFKMISNRLDDTRVEILSGSAIVEAAQLLEHNAITIVSHGADISLAKTGLYRIDADSTRLRVYQGEAWVSDASGKPLKVKAGHEVLLAENLQDKKFDRDDTDAFYRWCGHRDEYIATANISAARTARSSGYGSSGMSLLGGSWAFNPWFGMFTYVPFGGMYTSPFGYGYYSPLSVAYLYSPISPYYYGGGGVVTTRNGGSPIVGRGSIGGRAPAAGGISRGGMSGGRSIQPSGGGARGGMGVGGGGLRGGGIGRR